jgi:hypothetical protein
MALLQTGLYDVNSYYYPDKLGQANDEFQHYVSFFINVRGASKFYEQNIDSVNKPTAKQGGSISNSIDPTSASTGVKVATINEIGIGAATALGAISPKQAGTLTAVNAVGTAAVTAALQFSSVLKKDNLKRLKTNITLHMDGPPSVKYGVNYQDHDLGILGGFLSSSASSSNSITEQAGGLANLAALQIMKIPSVLPGFGSSSYADIAQFGAKVKTNPFREVFFEGVDYRRFNFKYKFLPKSPRESSAVLNIINTFKEHMHPELSSDGYFYIYPSEFEIKYFYNNKENGYFNKIAPCALTDMQVDYGGEQFSTFSNGAPSEIDMTLTFRELELLTKESIRNQGY